MMLIGAVCSFAGALSTGSTAIGDNCAKDHRQRHTCRLFRLAVIALAIYQVMIGLALMILRTELTGLFGAPFVGDEYHRRHIASVATMAHHSST